MMEFKEFYDTFLILRAISCDRLPSKASEIELYIFNLCVQLEIEFSSLSDFVEVLNDDDTILSLIFVSWNF